MSLMKKGVLIGDVYYVNHHTKKTYHKMESSHNMYIMTTLTHNPNYPPNLSSILGDYENSFIQLHITHLTFLLQ